MPELDEVLAAAVEERAGALAQVAVDPRAAGELARVVRGRRQRRHAWQEVEHQRAFTTLPAQNAQLEMVIQTRGSEHIQQVLQALREARMPAELDPY